MHVYMFMRDVVAIVCGMCGLYGVWGVVVWVQGSGLRPAWAKSAYPKPYQHMGLGFGVWGLGFGVWGLGFRV